MKTPYKTQITTSKPRKQKLSTRKKMARTTCIRQQKGHVEVNIISKAMDK